MLWVGVKGGNRNKDGKKTYKRWNREGRMEGVELDKWRREIVLLLQKCFASTRLSVCQRFSECLGVLEIASHI